MQIILEKLNDIEEAIRFCRETGDQTLWTRLIEQAEEKPGKDNNNNKKIKSIEIIPCRIHSRIIKSCW